MHKRKSRYTWSNRQIWPCSTEWNRAKANRVLLRERTGHNNHTPPTTQEKTLHMDITSWSTAKSDWLYSLHWSLRKAFLSILAIFWNSGFKWVYLSFPPLPFTSFLFTAICKASSDNHFAFLHFFFLRMVSISAFYTMSQTSIHCSSGTLSIRSYPLSQFLTSTV